MNGLVHSGSFLALELVLRMDLKAYFGNRMNAKTCLTIKVRLASSCELD